MKTPFVLFLTLLLLCLGTGAALAQTPDGFPPARETVCDNETGAAYGLCNAYCEAMDCESDDPQASETACTKVRTKFQNIAGRDVPCEMTCPCLSIPEFNATLAAINSCFDATVGESNTATVVSPEAVVPDPPFAQEFAAAQDAPDGTACGYVNAATQTIIVLPITPQEVASCIGVLHAAAASRGVPCQTYP